MEKWGVRQFSYITDLFTAGFRGRQYQFVSLDQSFRIYDRSGQKSVRFT